MNTQLNYLKTRLDYGETDVFEFGLQNIDMPSVVEEAIDGGVEEDLYNALYILQYIYNLTDIAEPVSNELYDKLYEKYRDVSGKEFVGPKVSKSYTGNKKMVEHSYPELRGSLDKVHFALEEDIPKKDTRKSLMGWVKKCMDDLKTSRLILLPTFKFDGLSVVLEFEDGELTQAVTRGITDDNLGLDITNLFKGLSLESIFEGSEYVCDMIRQCKKCGVKNEIIMTQDKFILYNQEHENDTKNNTRSATSSIVNAKDINTEMFKTYLRLQPLQISTEDEIDSHMLLYVGDIDNRHQYIIEDEDLNSFSITIDMLVNNGDLDSIKEQLENTVERVMVLAEDKGIPIDGVVFTIDERDDLTDNLGRKDNINKFQIAYKIAAGKAKTILKDVIFQLGLLGGVTPVAVVEPVTIMGNTITRPGLSNREKMERLDLNVGDEVIITYDIVPMLSKDETCKKGNGPKIEFPVNCPVCGERLVEYGKLYKCDNIECDSRLAGRVINYLTKVGIKGIGPAIISTFIDRGFINSIGDLYRIPQYREDIIQIKGFGPNQYDNIVNAIFSRNELYPHELLGALGIPDIGRTIMQKVCSEISLDDLLRGHTDDLLHRLVLIKGIADPTANKIVKGIESNQDIIDDIMKYVIIKPYEQVIPPDLTVLFTNVRDKDFEAFLALKNIKTAPSYNKSVDVVIKDTPERTSTKTEKAVKDGKRVITIEEAYKEFGYK